MGTLIYAPVNTVPNYGNPIITLIIVLLLL